MENQFRKAESGIRIVKDKSWLKKVLLSVKNLELYSIPTGTTRHSSISKPFSHLNKVVGV